MYVYVCICIHGNFPFVPPLALGCKIPPGSRFDTLALRNHCGASWARSGPSRARAGAEPSCAGEGWSIGDGLGVGYGGSVAVAVAMAASKAKKTQTMFTFGFTDFSQRLQNRDKPQSQKKRSNTLWFEIKY